MSSFNDNSSAPSSPNNRLSLLTEEEIEPYVRKKKSSGDSSRKKMFGLNDQEQNQLRTTINSRERRRMHDLNDAHEELRSCLPYEQGGNTRKLSKISTIVLACNWIRQLTNENVRLTGENESLRRQVASKEPSHPPTSVSFVAPYSIPCIRAFGQQCLCVSCVTLLTKKSE